MSALMAVALAVPSSAFAQNIGEEGGWQFRTPDDRAVAASIAQLIELQKSGAFRAQGYNGANGSGGVPATAANTNNVFQFIDQSTTTNNCSSTGAVGAPITCGGGGGNTVSGTSQTTSGSTQTSSNDISGNTFTSSNNRTSNNTNVGDTITSSNGSQ
jgi:hypothetical protein